MSRALYDPYGTGEKLYKKEVTRHANGVEGTITYYDENGDVIAWWFYDDQGNLLAGEKWEKGVYYVWVPNDEEDPTQGGEWVESEPKKEE